MALTGPTYSSEFVLWFGPDCDVLMTRDSDGLLVCSMCALDTQGRPFVTMQHAEVAAHLEAHWAVGHKVPEHQQAAPAR